MEIIKTIILGIIEGITEWLPISSTGHMIIAEDILKLNVSEEFWKMFLVVIQLGAILAVIFLYFNKLNPFSLKKSKTLPGALFCSFLLLNFVRKLDINECWKTKKTF